MNSASTSAFIIFLIVSLLDVMQGGQGVKKCSCKGNKEDWLKTRIRGGGLMQPDAHPFMAQISHDGEFICGGSLVGPRHVLTAGHCIVNDFAEFFSSPVLMKVLLGVHDSVAFDPNSRTQKYDVKKVIKHENFKIHEDKNILVNDIALLQTEKVVEFNEYIRPICLPFNIDMKRFRGAAVAGWGLTEYRGKSSRVVRLAYLSLISDADCRKSGMGPALETVPKIFDYVLCAYSRVSDACQGDSGGPLWVKDDNDNLFQIGIVSFGVKCGSFGKPGVYTRLTHYLDWLKRKLGGEYCLP